jgi:MFS family permease
MNPSLLAIVAEGFLSRLSFGVISFALPLYAHHLGLSLTEIGVLTSLNLAISLALQPMMGWAADRFGCKRSFNAAIGLRSLVALLLAFAGMPWHLYAIRTAHGLSKALRDPAANALIAEHGGKKAIASAFAWYATAKSVAGALGKAVAGILLTLTAANFSLVFLIAFVLSAFPILIVARFVQEARPGAQAMRRAGSTDAASVSAPPGSEQVTVLRPSLLPFIGLGFMLSSTADMLHGLLPVLATQYAGLSEAETGMLYMLSTLVILFSGPLFGWLSDNVSRRLVLAVRSGANIFSSLIFLVAPTFPGFIVGKAVDDIGKAAFKPAWGALMTHVSSFDRCHRARTMSLMSVGEDGGAIVGPMLAGILWNAWGIPVLLGVRVLLAVLTEVTAVVLSRSLAKLEGHEAASGYATGDTPHPARHEIGSL